MSELTQKDIHNLHLLLEGMRNHLTTIKGLIQLDTNPSHKDMIMKSIYELEDNISDAFFVLNSENLEPLPLTKKGE